MKAFGSQLNRPNEILRWTQAETTWCEVEIPTWARRVTVTFTTNAGFLAHGDVVDGETFATTQHYEDVPANGKYSIPLTPSPAGSAADQSSVFVRVASSTVIVVRAEESING